MGGLVDDEMLEAFAVVAPLDEVGTALRARWGGLLQRLSFYAFADLSTDEWAEVVTQVKADEADEA
jgi:hypothetical protein